MCAKRLFVEAGDFFIKVLRKFKVKKVSIVLRFVRVSLSTYTHTRGTVETYAAPAMQGGDANDGQGFLTVPSRPVKDPRPLLVLRRTSIASNATPGDVPASGLMAAGVTHSRVVAGEGSSQSQMKCFVGSGL